MHRTTPWAAALVALLSLAACEQPSGPDFTVAVVPGVAAVDPGKTWQFAVIVTGIENDTVRWSVEEAGGGTITSGGLYTAPATVGTYHVVATSVVDRTRQGTATVQVGGSAVCTLESPQPSALPPAQVIELGTHAVGETVTFDVPAGTGSVTVLQQGAEQLAARQITWKGILLGNTVIPLTLSVNGTVFFDDTVVPPDDPATWGSPDGIGAIYSYIPSPWTSAMTVPNTSNMLEHVAATGGVPSGTWSVVVNDYAEECRVIGSPTCVVGDGTTTYPPGRYDLKALLKPGAVAPAG